MFGRLLMPGPETTAITADVVALARRPMLNRLGAAIPGGLIFALKKDTLSAVNPVRLKDAQETASAGAARQCRRLHHHQFHQLHTKEQLWN